VLLEIVALGLMSDLKIVLLGFVRVRGFESAFVDVVVVAPPQVFARVCLRVGSVTAWQVVYIATEPKNFYDFLSLERTNAYVDSVVVLLLPNVMG